MRMPRTRPSCARSRAAWQFQNKVRGDLGKQVKAKEVNWEGIQKQTEEWLQVAEDLGKNKPPKGEEASWKEQTTST